ncbi:MAG: ABC transporter substrate-binding protein [Deltaproteobacteria bacterium]|nr:ABC transporter substrate-binding protein [Deltaproteobacteria bacterium]
MIKRLALILCILFTMAQPCVAKVYHIEVLQVTDLLQDAYTGFLEGLRENGIEVGKDLIINRHIIAASVDSSLWDKVMIYLKIKKTASLMVRQKPDLVLTISTPATKYSKDKFITAGIPVVFTCVAMPQAVGCQSIERAGPGFTGATLYVNSKGLFEITKAALPNTKTMAMIHSDDDNAIAFAEEAQEKASEFGIKVITKRMSRSSNIEPAVKEMIAKKIDAFGIPPDVYYALKNCRNAKILKEYAFRYKIPIIVYASYPFAGAILYIGSEFYEVGKLSGSQAALILKNGVKPGDIPVMRQKELSIHVDMDAAKRLGIKLPLDILQIAKPISTMASGKEVMEQ